MGFVRKKKEKKDPNRPNYNLIIRNFSSSESDESGDEQEHSDRSKGAVEDTADKGQNTADQSQGHSHGGEGHGHSHQGHGHSHGDGRCPLHDGDYEEFRQAVEAKQQERAKKKRSFLRWKDKVKVRSLDIC